MEGLDRDAVTAGVIVAVALALPITLITYAADFDDDSGWPTMALFAVIASFFAAGVRVGLRFPDRALLNAGTAGLVAYVAVQVLLIPVIVLGDDGFQAEHIPGLLFSAFLLANVALLGGLLGRVLHRRRGAT